MAAIPDELLSVDSAERMLGFLEEAVGGHVRAHVAVLPLSDEDQLVQSGWHWEGWEVRVDDPYFAVGVHRGELERVSGEVKGLLSYSDAPVLFTLVDGSCCFLVTLMRSRGFRTMVDDFRGEQYPAVGRPHWDSASLFELLQRIERDNRCGSVIVTDYVYRCPIDPTYERGPWETHRSWTRKHLSDAIRELSSLDAWVRRIAFECRCFPPISTTDLLSGAIARGGEVSIVSGVEAVWRLLIEPAAEAATQARAAFAARARGRQFERPVRPLEIVYAGDVFEDVEVNSVFIDKMRKLDDASVSVYHGNPYLHLGLVDYLDGSSFSVWVVDADRITVVPGARASTSAIERLIVHIMDEFREGEVADLVWRG